MTIRTASTCLTAVALALGTSGAALADDNAAGVQYQPEDRTTVTIVPPETPPAPPAEAPPVEVLPAAEVPQQEIAPETAEAPAPAVVPTVTKPSRKAAEPVFQPVAAPATAPTAQAAQAPTGGLPVTGYDVVPVALGGLALLALGAILRRQTRRLN